MTERIVNYLDLTREQKAKARFVKCGPDCACDTPKTGISIGRFDSFGFPHPEATGVILDIRTNEWVVYVCDPDAPMYQAEAARYPVSEVEAIRYLPNETRLYSHTVIDDDIDTHGTQARQAVEQ
jgi:hypothetical protein